MVYLEITLKIADANRPAAAGVYERYKAPFLSAVSGAKSKQLLVREADVQVLHGFESVAQAQGDLFNKDVVTGLAPLLQGEPDVRIYQVA
jgi:hypothetical protein